MNQKQAKRLRRAQRKYVAENIKSLAKGPRAVEAAQKLAGLIRMVWHRIPTAKLRGRVGAHLKRGDLQDAVSLAHRAVLA